MSSTRDNLWHYQVVLVEDNPLLGLVLSEQLQAAGISFRAATNGRQALKVIRRYRPLIVILDLAVTGLSGLEIVDALRSDPVFADLQSLKVIVYASEDLTESERESLSLGTRTYFYTKSIDDHDMGQIVKQILSGAHD
jgi:CheY-like chemotaxis protein